MRVVTMKQVLLPICAAIALSSSPARAVDEAAYLLKSVADLGALCGAPEDPSAIHMCEGFLVGAHRVLQAVGRGIEEPLYCLPDDGSVTRDAVPAISLHGSTRMPKSRRRCHTKPSSNGRKPPIPAAKGALSS